MPGRRWSNGNHQAVEAKEHVPIQEENKHWHLSPIRITLDYIKSLVA